MEKMSKAVLFGLTGKLAPVVGCTWKGQSYMRSMPQQMSNPRTPDQQGQRGRFKQVMSFLNTFKGYLCKGYMGGATSRTTLNAAQSYVMKNAIVGSVPDFVIDYAKVLVSRGLLAVANNPSARLEVGKVVFRWEDNSGQGDAQVSEKAMPLVYNISRGEAHYHTEVATREECVVELEISNYWRGDTVTIYLGFINGEGNETSNTVFFGVMVIE